MNSAELGGIVLALSHTDFAHTSGANKTVAYDATDMVLDGKTYEIAADATAKAVAAKDGNTGEDFEKIKPNTVVAYLAYWEPTLSTPALGMAAGSPKNLVDDKIDKAPELPGLPEDAVPIGYLVVANTSDTVDFTFGTDNWNKTGTTTKSGALAAYPSRPPLTEL